MIRIELSDANGTIAHVTGPDSLAHDRRLAHKLYDAAREHDRERTPTACVMVHTDRDDAEYEDHPRAAEIIKQWLGLQNSG